ncbi:MAG: hypothetical protein ACI9F9_002141, partial [Candidatus Paceibacteria bacterium]
MKFKSGEQLMRAGGPSGPGPSSSGGPLVDTKRMQGEPHSESETPQPDPFTGDVGPLESDSSSVHPMALDARDRLLVRSSTAIPRPYSWEDGRPIEVDSAVLAENKSLSEHWDDALAFLRIPLQFLGVGM